MSIFAACPTCRTGRLVSRTENERGHCCRCEVASWSDERQRAMRRLLLCAFDGSTDAEKDAAIEAAFAASPDKERTTP
jgi:hypothetical protein